MKVIIDGSNVSKEISCPECYSQLEYTAADVEKRDSSALPGFHFIAKYIVCPVCKADIKIKSE